MRFLLTRRWLVFAVVVALLAWLAVELGDWQFRRLDEREAANRQLATNLSSSPLPVSDLMRIGQCAFLQRSSGAESPPQVSGTTSTRW
ncbi:MAG: SURF1 family cytochrome oxidase biogenesis protein [Marmoricola sp.]